jgi:hypothetical protein
MKFKTTYLGLFLIILFFASTLAFAGLQSFYYKEEKIEIPTQNIINYELNPEQESYLMENGYTIIKFEYSVNCLNCLEQKNFLEQIANSPFFKNQVFLQEILTTTTIPKIKIASMYGQKILEDETQEKIIDSLCELLVNPPVQCVLREVG